MRHNSGRIMTISGSLNLAAASLKRVRVEIGTTSTGGGGTTLYRFAVGHVQLSSITDPNAIAYVVTLQPLQMDFATHGDGTQKPLWGFSENTLDIYVLEVIED